MKQFIKTKLREEFNYNLIEELMDEDYPSTFNMDAFKALRSFKERVDYCETHLKRISSGSGRIAYMVDNTKVLKLAKNKKGVGQCEVESNWGNDSYFGILAHTFDSHPDGLWIEMELARKVTKGDFKRLEGIWFDALQIHLSNWNARMKGQRPIYGEDEKLKAQMDENEWISEIKELSDAMDVGAGDFGRLSTYGLVKRDGQDAIVVIDFGLDRGVYNTYYS